MVAQRSNSFPFLKWGDGAYPIPPYTVECTSQLPVQLYGVVSSLFIHGQGFTRRFVGAEQIIGENRGKIVRVMRSGYSET